MSQTHNIFFDENYDGDRFDAALCEAISDFSRSACLKLIKEGAALLNGKAEKPSKTIREGDVACVTVPDAKPVEILPQDIPIDIVWQDNCMAVINKQQGLTVHPANGVYTDTLVNALLFHIKDLSGINGDIRPGIVHRLDKDTSGLMLIAKNDVAHRKLAGQIATKTCKRIYYALLEGVVKEDSGVVEQPIGRSKTDRKKMAVVSDGKWAKTYYTVLERFKNFTLMKFELATGRTHQIRVHAKFLGHPVVGDPVYGFKNQKFKLNGQLLHSKQISFFHPISGEQMTFDSELPDYFKKILDALK